MLDDNTDSGTRVVLPYSCFPFTTHIRPGSKGVITLKAILSHLNTYRSTSKEIFLSLGNKGLDQNCPLKLTVRIIKLIF